MGQSSWPNAERSKVDKQQKIAELETKIERLQQEQSYLQQWDSFINPLESFTVAEKVRIFDELYVQARQHLQGYVEDLQEPKDGDCYIYEAVLSKMLGEEVWDIIGAIGT